MISGKGSQAWITYSYQLKRCKALKNRKSFTQSELEKLEVDFPLGGGRTNPVTYKIKQFPFPTRDKRRTIDIRTLPWIGD